MGKGANLTFSNQTPLTLEFGTSDKNDGWDDLTIDRVQGDIAPYSESKQFYIEAAGMFGTSSVKFTVREKGPGNKPFANVHIEESGKAYTQAGSYQDRLRAEAAIAAGDQYTIRVSVTPLFQPASWITDMVAANPALAQKPVSALNLPGTHDSATSGDRLADIGHTGNVPLIPTRTFAQCQDWSIGEQLRQGIRFLDIRLASFSHLAANNRSMQGLVALLNAALHTTAADTLFVVHGRVLFATRFAEVLDDCQSFLRDHPGEFIVMSVKSEEAGFDDTQWAAYANNPLFYQGDTYPTLEQARGRIVLLRRFGGDQFVGFDFHVPDNTADSGILTRHQKGSSTGYRYAVQDKYDIDLEKAYEKQAAVRTFLDTHLHSDPAVLVVNFISYVGKYSGITTGGINLPYPRDAAGRMTAWLLPELTSRRNGHFGIVAMDFPVPAVINALIASNMTLKS